MRRTLARKTPLVGRALAVLGLVTGAALLATPSASATDQPQDFVRNWATGRCLDMSASGDVYTSPCQFGNNYQQWKLSITSGNVPNNVGVFYNVGAGRYMNWSGDNDVSSGGADQFARWLGIGPDWQHVSLKAQWGQVDRCLDSNAAGDVYAIGCNGGGFQQWKFGF